MTQGLWAYAHVLLLVFWLGTDLGVLILARAARRTDLDAPQRLLLLRYALVIDLAPRICFALMFPVGLQLAASVGWVQVPVLAHALAWIVAAAWLALLFAFLGAEGTPRQVTLGRANLLLQVALAALVLGLGVWSVAGAGPFAAPWLAWKVLLFGLLFPAAIMIDVAFRPVGPAFARLASEGSSPAVEATIAGAVDRTVGWVLVVYALVLAIAFLGVVQP